MNKSVFFFMKYININILYLKLRGKNNNLKKKLIKNQKVLQIETYGCVKKRRGDERERKRRNIPYLIRGKNGG